MKKLLLVLITAVVVSMSTVAFADDLRVGIIDVRQVLQKSPQVANMQKKLQDEFSSRDKQIQEAQAQLQQDTNKLNRDSSVMSANDRASLSQKIQTEQQNLRTMQVNFQKDLYAKQSEQMQSVLNQLQNVVTKVAKQKGLNIVIVKDAVAYANNEVDITEDVMREMK